MLESFPELDSQAASVASDLRRGVSRVHVVDGIARSHLLLDVAARVPDAVFARVPPHHLDRSVYTVLSIASQCNAGADVAAAVRRDPSRIDDALAVLSTSLGERPLIVDGVDRLDREEHELIDVLGSDERRLREWIRERARLTGGRTAEPGALTPSLGVPSSEDDRALWERVGKNYGTFRLARAGARIVGGDFERWGTSEILRDVWTALSDDVRRVISLLLVHDRPIDRALFSGVDGVRADAIDAARDSGLVAGAGGRIWVADEWAHLRDLLPAHRRDDLRRVLAESFVRAAESAGGEPLSVLEAHRHLAELGDLTRAAKFAEFGALLLLDLARRSSIAGQYGDSIRAYQVVLSLDDQLRAAGERGGIGARSRAYAIHYRAYNRYKAGVHASPLETLERYREALTLWPEHALFWSRTIACGFVAGRYDDALRTRDEAFERVPPHPNRTTLLVQRTVERLLDRRLVLPALLVWDGRQPETLSQRRVQDRLLEAARSWTAADLWAPGAPRLAFRPGASVAMRASDDGYAFAVFGIESEAARRPSYALRALIETVVTEGIRALERPDDVTHAWLATLDESVLARADDERARWLAGLCRLRDRAREGSMPEPQLRTVLDVLQRLRAVAPTLRRPTTGPSADGERYQLSWSYRDRPSLTLEVEVGTDGSIEWFFREGERVEGSEDPVRELPGRVLDVARLFA